MKKRAKIYVYGRVQGVNFRYSTKKQAEKMGLSGFARNEPDGSVYIEAEGGERRLKDLIAWCGKGPPFAEVSGIDHSISNELENYKGFEIKY